MIINHITAANVNINVSFLEQYVNYCIISLYLLNQIEHEKNLLTAGNGIFIVAKH